MKCVFLLVLLALSACSEPEAKEIGPVNVHDRCGTGGSGCAGDFYPPAE